MMSVFVHCESSKIFTNLVFPSETKTNRNRLSLKHSNGQSRLFPIVKPRQTASPGDQITKTFTVPQSQESVLYSFSYKCKESRMATCMETKILITSRKYLEWNSKQLWLWIWCWRAHRRQRTCYWKSACSSHTCSQGLDTPSGWRRAVITQIICVADRLYPS